MLHRNAYPPRQGRPKQARSWGLRDLADLATPATATGVMVAIFGVMALAPSVRAHGHAILGAWMVFYAFAVTIWGFVALLQTFCPE